MVSDAWEPPSVAGNMPWLATMPYLTFSSDSEIPILTSWSCHRPWSSCLPSKVGRLFASLVESWSKEAVAANPSASAIDCYC